MTFTQALAAVVLGISLLAVVSAAAAVAAFATVHTFDKRSGDPWWYRLAFVPGILALALLLWAGSRWFLWLGGVVHS